MHALLQVAQVQKAEDEKVELEKENSALQKKLIQEVEKYNYYMAVVTQVCTSVYRLKYQWRILLASAPIPSSLTFLSNPVV